MPLNTDVVKHVIGGVSIEIEGRFPPQLSATSPEPPDLVLHLTAGSTASALRPAGAPAFESDTWAAFVDEEQVLLCIRGAEPDAMRIDLPRRGLRGRLHFHDGVAAFPFLYPADQLLVIHTLSVAGGLLAHAAAIAGRGGGYLVAGPSGAGKTTMSRFAAALGARVLSDERTIVRPRPGAPGQWLLGGTPWPGEGGFADNSSVPLRGLILLEQADHDELVPLSLARALALLYRCHFPPLWDPEAATRTLDHLERLVHEVPAFLFRNRKGPDAARLLLDRLGGAE